MSGCFTLTTRFTHERVPIMAVLIRLQHYSNTNRIKTIRSQLCGEKAMMIIHCRLGVIVMLTNAVADDECVSCKECITLFHTYIHTQFFEFVQISVHNVSF